LAYGEVLYFAQPHLLATYVNKRRTKRTIKPFEKSQGADRTKANTNKHGTAKFEQSCEGQATKPPWKDNDLLDIVAGFSQHFIASRRTKINAINNCRATRWRYWLLAGKHI